MHGKNHRKIKKILVTGNLGYIGTVLTSRLTNMGYSIVGLDTEYYGENCIFYDVKSEEIHQISRDIRDVTPNDFNNVDAVIHLAALSNDPLGEFDPQITEQINFEGTLRVAHYAKKAGVMRFVYASSQSMYGISNVDEIMDEDNSLKNPITAYAKTKWRAECELQNLNDLKFTVVCFRPSTVYGASPRLRCDIIYNNLIGCAYTTGKIEIKSDGTPWRPAIHIQDVCSAFIAGIVAPKELIEGESFNVGIKEGNYTVRQLSNIAQQVVSDSKLVFTGEHGPDSRTYRVGFDKILSKLINYYSPVWDLVKGGKELIEMFNQVGFSEKDFRSQRCIRLLRLKELVKSKRLDSNLRWRL